MIDYDLLARQRDTLRELLEIDAATDEGTFLEPEQRDAIAGVSKLVSWMLDYAPEKPAIVRADDELSPAERGTVAEALRELAGLGDVWHDAGRAPDSWPEARHELHLLARRIDPS